MKIIKVDTCYKCPYAESGLFDDRCGLLKSNNKIEVKHKKEVRVNCPLKDEDDE